MTKWTMLGCALAVACCGFADEKKGASPCDGGIRAGFARVDITPPVGAFIPGYFSQRIAVGARTPLVTECVAFADGNKTALVYSVDNLHLTKVDVDSITAQLKAGLGVPPELVFVHSTHIHTGAATDTSYYTTIESADARRLSDEYGRGLAPKFLHAARQAIADLKPATFRIARGEVRPAVSFVRRYRMKDGSVITNPNRNRPELVDHALGEADNSVQVVRVTRQGAPDIALVNFQTHPDTVGGLLYDADWPGVLRATFEQALGDGTRLFFMNGAQGDVNHFQVLGENPFWKDHSSGKYRYYMGRAIAGAALAVWDRGVKLDAKGGVCGKIVMAKVASNRPDARRVEAIRLFDAGREKEIKGFGHMEIMAMTAKTSNARKLMNGPEFFEMPVTSLSIGGVLAFAGFPGEPFTEIGSRVKAGSPFAMTFVGCLVNDSFGYLPSSSASAEGGYEVVASRFGATCGDTLVKVQLDSLKALFGAKAP